MFPYLNMIVEVLVSSVMMIVPSGAVVPILSATNSVDNIIAIITNFFIDSPLL